MRFYHLKQCKPSGDYFALDYKPRWLLSQITVGLKCAEILLKYLDDLQYKKSSRKFIVAIPVRNA